MASHEYHQFGRVVLAKFDRSGISEANRNRRWARSDDANEFLDGLRRFHAKLDEGSWALVVDFGGIDNFGPKSIELFDAFVEDPNAAGS